MTSHNIIENFSVQVFKEYFHWPDVFIPYIIVADEKDKNDTKEYKLPALIFLL